MRHLMCVVMAALVAVSTGAAADLESVTKKAGRLYPGARVRQTAYPEIYRLILPGETNALLLNGDATLIANNGAPNWRAVATNAPQPHSVDVEINRAALPALPADKAVRIGAGERMSFILISAVDCPACVAAEKYLAGKGYTYGVLPRSLDASRTPLARSVYCSRDPGRAWTAMMVKRQPPAPAQCDYPQVDIEDAAALFGHMSSPVFLFADGEVWRGAPSNSAEAAQLKQMIEGRISAGTIF